MEKEQLQELIENNKEDIFSEIKEEISDETVTDIEWDGYNLWITQLGRGCYISMKELSDRYMDNLSIRLANIMGASFNRMHPILEANTESLRISIWHESRCGRKSMAIRKIPQKLRFGHADLVRSDYAPESIITLLENCVTAHLSTVIGGQPHAGKTELLKYLATYIPAEEKVGVYEDNQEFITDRLILITNVLSFLWIRRLHIRILSGQDCAIISTGFFCLSQEDRR